MKVTQTTEIVLNGEKYVLEEGDEVTVNEGILGSILGSITRKLVPFPRLKEKINKFMKDLDPEEKEAFIKLFGDR